MENLTFDDLERYKRLKTWQPLQAALIVCLIEPSSINYNWLLLPEKAKNIYEKSVTNFKNGEMQFFEVEKIIEPKLIKFFKKYCSDFCQEDDSGHLFLACFKPCYYIKWILDSRLSTVPECLGVKFDSQTGGLVWLTQPDESSDMSGCIIDQKTLAFQHRVQSQNLDIKFIYYKLKQFEYWTLGLGIVLLSCPYLFFSNYNQKIKIKEIFSELDIDLEPYRKAIKAGTLKVDDFSKEEATKEKNWDINFIELKITPDDFLEFVRKNKLISIPSELNVKKQPDGDCGSLDCILHQNILLINSSIRSQNLNMESIYHRMNKLDYWTLGEGIILLKSPCTFTGYPYHEIVIEKIFNDFDIDLEPYIRAIQTGTLKVFEFSKEEAIINKNWDINFIKLRITPYDFLDFVRKNKLYQIPPELNNIKRQGFDYTEGENAGLAATEGQCDENKIESEKVLRSNQKDKIEVQKIGRQVWQKYQILDIVHVKRHPDIKKIAGGNYGMYKEKTIHKWLSEIAPKNAKEKGQRPPEIRNKQKKICKKLNIQHNTKF